MKRKEIQHITNKQGVCFRVGDWIVPTDERKEGLKEYFIPSYIEELARPKQIVSMNHSEFYDTTNVVIKIQEREFEDAFELNSYRLANTEEIKKEKIKAIFHPVTTEYI